MNNNSVSGSGLRDSQMDFISYWADQTVEEAILRGVELRQKKAQPLPARDCDVVNIDFIKPPCNMKHYSGSRRKKHKKRRRSRSKSPRCREVSPSPSTKTAKRRKCVKSKTKAPCALRIAELAVPTKRQCLDTWRTKYNTLPAFMIERLRQHIFDQRPVVQISDAIYCFKRNKCNMKKSCESAPEKPMGKKCEYKLRKPLRTSDVKALSAIFGHNIAKKLYKPVNINLNAGLEKIANVISYDIANLMCKSRKMDMNKTMNTLIHTDVIKKVTAWVSGILDESAYKILEDQLIDFEEEAGPALDCIDDLFNDAWNICKPEPEVYEPPSKDKEFLKEDVGEGDTVEQFELQETDTYENIEDYLNNEIVLILNNIDKDADIKSDEYLDVEDGLDLRSTEEPDTDINTDDYEESEDADIKDTLVNTDNYLESEDGTGLEPSEGAEMKDTDIQTDDSLESEDDIAIKLGEIAQLKVTEDGIALELNDDGKVADEQASVDAEIAPENTDDVIDTFTDAIDDNKDEENPPEQLTDDAADVNSEGSNENNKKVTFTETVNDGDAEQSAQAGDVDWKKSVDAMEFSAPNEDLLSDADELWPDEIQLPVIRPSQSVSKSITSLGKINEVEEISSNPPDKPSDSEKREEKGTVKAKATAMRGDKEKNDNKKAKKKIEIKKPGKADEKVTSLPKEKKGTKKPKPTEKDTRLSESKADKFKVRPHSPNAKKRRSSSKWQVTSQGSPKRISKIDQIVSKSKGKPPKTSKDKDKEMLKNIETTVTIFTSQSVKELDESLDEVGKVADVKFSTVKVKPDYRVNVQTAPAWINRNFGEPSCSCVNIDSKSKVSEKRTMNENEIRKWCRDLQQGYENIKIWNEWIDNSSETVCLLKQEIGSFECSEICKNKEWTKLKSNIDKDAILWKKLTQNTRERLQCYRKIYHKQSESQVKNVIMCDCETPYPSL